MMTDNGSSSADDFYHMGERLYCPCPESHTRWLEEENNETTTDDDNASEDTTSSGETWEVVFTCIVLVGMFAALLSDRLGADSVMLTALTFFLASEIISIKEGLAGFSNEGLLTVLVLFVVAEGISRTGALDWYMNKLLGRPRSEASAQLRLMVPIAIVSAFLNNTPVVAVMIPIVQRWGKNIGVSHQQLLIPLSFASIMGGTCTLIGTSTNLVVKGLLDERYANDDSVTIGLFSLGEYGVPLAMAGMTYILLVSPFLLPGNKRSDQSNNGGANPLEDTDDVLLGARLTQWSPAAGRSVKRSGLRDTGGIYLVSVHRYTTGNVHRAVGQDFVLNAGDLLYFTGLIDSFGEFCEEHGLEMITNEIEHSIHAPNLSAAKAAAEGAASSPEEGASLEGEVGLDMDGTASRGTSGDKSHGASSGGHRSGSRSPFLPTLHEDESGFPDIPIEIGVTKESLVQADTAERSRSINRLTDMIRGHSRDEAGLHSFHAKNSQNVDPPKIVVTIEKDLVVIGVDSRDRPGLLLDISKGLLRLRLQLHHTEAAVVDGRSLSIWRCEPIAAEIPDLEEVWTVLTALLEQDSGILAVKKRGLRVIRARVTPVSRLIGRRAADLDFRETYKAAIVAIQRGGKNINKALSTVAFESGDSLILQASDDSPLLKVKPPTKDYYKKLAEEAAGSAPTMRRPSSVTNLVNMVKLPGLSRRASRDKTAAINLEDTSDSNLHPPEQPTAEDDNGTSSGGDSNGRLVDGDEEIALPPHMESPVNLDAELILRDLQVSLSDDNNEGANVQPSREFLTPMVIAPNSQMAGRTIAQEGINKLPGIVLISIDRPSPKQNETTESKRNKKPKVTIITNAPPSDRSDGGDNSESNLEGFDGSLSVRTAEPTYTTIAPEEPLQVGDVLWFAGSASAVGDLRKIPGLNSYVSSEVDKINEKVHDRRLVQAVIARQGPLVGKTVKEVRFRTRYGAAVIAVHREGKRIHDHPGKITLQAGDVLLLEAGSTFMGKSSENERSFALLSEVKDSAPPRLSLLVPALAITATMLAVYTAGVASLLVCALVASILMVALGILSEQEARDAINWEVYITIACAFGIGTALVNSGVAGAAASFLVDVGEAVGIGDAGLFGAVYIATVLISNVVTNNAAAALVFPIALDAAETTGADRVLMSYCLMLGASASFMTPFGYTTNLMIYGPGGYKSKDFLAIGTPMQLLLWVLTILYLSNSSGWWLNWLITAVVFAAVVSFRVFNVAISDALAARKKTAADSSKPETDESKMA